MSDVAITLAEAVPGVGRVTESAPMSLVASVTVHTDVHEVVAEWRALVATSPATPYQHPDWLVPWIETIGAAQRLVPMIVVARDAAGVPLALLPLGIDKRGALATGVFLGGRDANFNMGLFRRGTVWTRESLLDLLRRAARSGRQRVDLFALTNQPLTWEGFANPLAALDHQPSPSFAYKATLEPDAERFFKSHLSRDNRKKLRQKMTRLAGFGAVAAIRASGPGEIADVLDALLLQRRERCEALGLPTEELPRLRQFLDRAASGAAPAVELHALRCGDRIVATLAGTRRNGRFSGMVTAFTADPAIGRASPGELLLAEVMRRACAEGLTTFDLGIGEARYKEIYCPETEALFDSLVPVSLAGRAAAAGESLRLRLKRRIKRSAWAWAMVKELRRRRAVRSGGATDRTVAGQD